jgi:CheY-like chemotaxis protein
MSESLLVVDDDRAIAQLTALWLKSAGYSAITAFNGYSALAAAATHRPQLILLDIRMPDLDGFEVRRRLRQTPETAHIPVMFLSANVQEAASQEAIQAGARFFLSKPYEVKDLLSAVRAVLETSSTETSQAR